MQCFLVFNINFKSFYLTSKHKILTSFYNERNTFYSLKLPKESTKEKKATVYNNASEMCTSEMYRSMHDSFKK